MMVQKYLLGYFGNGKFVILKNGKCILWELMVQKSRIECYGGVVMIFLRKNVVM